MHLSLYKADKDYCDYLRKTDPYVPYTMNNKENRPFVGMLLSINGFDYYAPLSSPKKKHLSMKNQIDFIKINNGIYGAINLNNMIPISNKYLIPIDSNILSTDTVDDIKYKTLLNNQLSWCNTISNRTNIISKANNLYNMIINEKAPESIVSRCCDFLNDESKCFEYELVKPQLLGV